MLGGIGVAMVGLIGLILYTYTLVPELPELRNGTPEINLTTVVYADDGQRLGHLFRENRTWLPFDQIPDHVVDALVATEDHRFYRHDGIDLVRTVGVAWGNLWGKSEGASTITMQLARNLYPEEIGNAHSVRRKVKEMMTALKMEEHYRKQEILEMYLNTVAFAYNAFGLEAAARTYFSKHASELTIDEGAVLIGMLKATTRYNPVLNPERARGRRNVVLSLMRQHGYLPGNQYQRYAGLPLELNFQLSTHTTDLAPHFAEYIRKWLTRWGEENGHDVYAEGLRVHTTLDPAMQAMAEQAVARQMDNLQAVVDYEWSRRQPLRLSRNPAVYRRYREQGFVEPFQYLWETQDRFVTQVIRETPAYARLLEQGHTPVTATDLLRQSAGFMDSLRTAKTRLEAGLVVMDPRTNHVKAWVGGRDFAQDQYDKVGQARRQPGSTFKPFVYAEALSRGRSPYEPYKDSIYTYQVRGRTWRPANSGGGASGAYVHMRTGLVWSKNTVTAQVMENVGPRNVVRLAQLMGVNQSTLLSVPSLALGTSEVTLLEMATAYATLAAYGQYRPPLFITRIEDRYGNPLEVFDPIPTTALQPEVAYSVIDIMRDVVDQGTATAIRNTYGIRADVAGKTGTTQENADGWFIMIHPELVTGAWVGFNDRRLTFRTSYWGQGGHNALHLVGDFFQQALEADPSLGRPRFNPPRDYEPYEYLPLPADTLGLAAPQEPYENSIRFRDDALDPEEVLRVLRGRKRDERGRIAW